MVQAPRPTLAVKSRKIARKYAFEKKTVKLLLLLFIFLFLLVMPKFDASRLDQKHENLFSDQLAVYAAIGCLTNVFQNPHAGVKFLFRTNKYLVFVSKKISGPKSFLGTSFWDHTFFRIKFFFHDQFFTKVKDKR